MNAVQRVKVFDELGKSQGGVFTTSDLKTFFGIDGASSLVAALRPYLDGGKVVRAKRGLYLASQADPLEAVRRICPDAVLSFGNVLASHLLVGSVPARQFRFTGSCRDQLLAGPEWTIIVHHQSEHLRFGWSVDDRGVCVAEPEKAVLDCLVYHQMGVKFSFDLETGIDRAGISHEKFLEYVERYPNPRFRARCKRWIDAI